MLGALLTKGLLLDEGRATHYGAAEVSGLLGGNFAGAIVEAIGTFCLVLVILAAVYSKKSLKDWAPLAIGTTLGFIVMVGGPLTGGSFNPARWFGPALVGDELGRRLALPGRPDRRLRCSRPPSSRFVIEAGWPGPDRAAGAGQGRRRRNGRADKPAEPAARR